MCSIFFLTKRVSSCINFTLGFSNQRKENHKNNATFSFFRYFLFLRLIILHFLGSLKTVLRQAQKPAPPKSVPSSSSKTGPIIPIYVPESLPLGADTVETQVMIQGEMDEMAKSLSTSKGQKFGEVEVPTDPPLFLFTDFEANVFLCFSVLGNLLDTI